MSSIDQTNPLSLPVFRSSLERCGCLTPEALTPEADKPVQRKTLDRCAVLARLAAQRQGRPTLDENTTPEQIYEALNDTYELEQNAIYTFPELLRYVEPAADAKYREARDTRQFTKMPKLSLDGPTPIPEKLDPHLLQLDATTTLNNPMSEAAMSAWDAVVTDAIQRARRANPSNIGVPRSAFEKSFDLDHEPPMMEATPDDVPMMQPPPE